MCDEVQITTFRDGADNWTVKAFNTRTGEVNTISGRGEMARRIAMVALDPHADPRAGSATTSPSPTSAPPSR